VVAKGFGLEKTGEKLIGTVQNPVKNFKTGRTWLKRGAEYIGNQFNRTFREKKTKGGHYTKRLKNKRKTLRALPSSSQK
jgi:hypothetical protein